MQGNVVPAETASLWLTLSEGRLEAVERPLFLPFVGRKKE